MFPAGARSDPRAATHMKTCSHTSHRRGAQSHHEHTRAQRVHTRFPIGHTVTARETHAPAHADGHVQTVLHSSAKRRARGYPPLHHFAPVCETQPRHMIVSRVYVRHPKMQHGC